MTQKTWTGASSDGDWSSAANWDSTAVPGAGDDVRIPPGTGPITAGLDQSGVALGDVIFEEGHTGAVGSTSAYLQIDPDRFEFAGGGQAFIDLGAAAIPVEIKKTASAATGERGLYLKGTGITTLSVRKGSVGVAAIHQSTSTVGTIQVSGAQADVWIGEGCKLTTCNVHAGKCELRQGSTTTTVNVYGGTFTSEEAGLLTTVNVWGGKATLNSVGTIAALNCEGGETDMMQSGSTRSVTTLKVNPGARLSYDPAVVGVTTRSAPDRPVRIQATAP